LNLPYKSERIHKNKTDIFNYMIKGIKVCSAFYAKTFGHSYDYIN